MILLNPKQNKQEHMSTSVSGKFFTDKKLLIDRLLESRLVSVKAGLSVDNIDKKLERAIKARTEEELSLIQDV